MMAILHEEEDCSYAAAVYLAALQSAYQEFPVHGEVCIMCTW